MSGGLRDRLLRHKRPAGDTPAEAAGAVKAAALQEAADAEWARIGAHMEQSEAGAFVMRRREYSLAAYHGRYALHQLIGQSDQLHVLLAPPGARASALQDEARLPHDQLLYLDTETTGLGIGAGNVPFMIGIGFYEAERFVVEQMFIRHPGEELAMLQYLQGKLKQHPYLVSYNGKTFDWPIIKNRYILNRMPSEPFIAGHLDFLFPSRSLWKHTLPSCRLGKVEEQRLHVIRYDDVPGSLAPALYFQYLAERNVSVVEGVFLHNELDILSLAGLSIHFAGALNGQSDMTQMELEELYRLVLWLDKLDRRVLAAKALELLTDRLIEQETEEAANYILPAAQVYKQQHRFAVACRLWKLYVERKGERSTASIEPYIELSMHYEHREKQAEQALYYAEQALNKVWQRQALKRSYGVPGGVSGTGTISRQAATAKDAKEQELIASLEKRIERLRLKVKRAFPATMQSSSITTPRSPRKLAHERAKRSHEYVMDSLI